MPLCPASPCTQLLETRACAGQKRAREMWFLARLYDAQQALQMGLVNTVVPLARLEEETTVWWGCHIPGVCITQRSRDCSLIQDS